MRKQYLILGLLSAASFASAAPKTAVFDPFVTALEPCLEYARKDASGRLLIQNLRSIGSCAPLRLRQMPLSCALR